MDGYISNEYRVILGFIYIIRTCKIKQDVNELKKELLQTISVLNCPLFAQPRS